MEKQTKGFVVVASRNSNFYSYAINLIQSIKDYYPEALITLCTEERFLDGREEEADNVIFCDSHYRAKLWGMANSPYDITMYVDADMECEHEDIMTGLLVDAVSDIIALKNDDLQPPPDMQSNNSPNVVSALTLVDERMIRVLDLSAIVSTDHGQAA